MRSSLRGVEVRPVRRGALGKGQIRQQALDTAAFDCIMLQRTNTELRVLQRHDAERLI